MWLKLASSLLHIGGHLLNIEYICTYKALLNLHENTVL